METILLTGATGFIGSKLLRYLLNNTVATVYVLVRQNLSYAHPRLHPIITDLTSPHALKEVPANIDTILHLAQSKYYRDPYTHINDMVAINVQATANLLEWARLHDVKQFLFTSTGNVYSPCSEPLTEEHPCEPSSIYAATKRAAEMLVNQYSQDFSTVILRLFGVYGPGQKNMLIANMIERIMAEEEIILAGEAGIYMTPLYIEDCIKLILTLLPLTKTSTQWLFNAGGVETVTLKDVCLLSEQLIGKKANIRYTADLPRYLLGKSNKLIQFSNFQLFTPLKAGLSATVREYTHAS